MRFRSYLAPCTKEHRALVLSLSLSDLLARGGERIGVFGGRPYTGRHVAHRIAEALVADDRGEKSLPPPARLSRFAECIFQRLARTIEATAECLEAIAGQGVRGHLVQILDPAEETLPYDGRTEFTSIERNERVTIGRVEQLRERYQARIKRHRTDLIELTKRLDWSFLVHHTTARRKKPPRAGVSRPQTDYRYRARRRERNWSEPHP
jgi:hypothetical protein